MAATYIDWILWKGPEHRTLLVYADGTSHTLLNNTYNTEQTSTENYVQVLGKLVLNSELTDTEVGEVTIIKLLRYVTSYFLK